MSFLIIAVSLFVLYHVAKGIERARVAAGKPAQIQPPSRKQAPAADQETTV